MSSAVWLQSCRRTSCGPDIPDPQRMYPKYYVIPWHLPWCSFVPQDESYERNQAGTKMQRTIAASVYKIWMKFGEDVHGPVGWVSKTRWPSDFSDSSVTRTLKFAVYSLCGNNIWYSCSWSPEEYFCETRHLHWCTSLYINIHEKSQFPQQIWTLWSRCSCFPDDYKCSTVSSSLFFLSSTIKNNQIHYICSSPSGSIGPIIINRQLSWAADGAFKSEHNQSDLGSSWGECGCLKPASWKLIIIQPLTVWRLNSIEVHSLKPQPDQAHTNSHPALKHFHFPALI